MNSNNDYYRVLGVLDDAEDIVIKAAYRALAQRYHPDRWTGDIAEGHRRMAEINSAYAVLSDLAKRAAYDAQRDKNQFRDESDENEDTSQASAINKDWGVATKYYPDLQKAEKALNAISPALAFTFRLTLLESKRFGEWSVVAHELDAKYFSKYFGANVEVQEFAKELILEGRKDAAKELNEAVRVLGNVGISVIEKIARDFKFARFKSGSAKFWP